MQGLAEERGFWEDSARSSRYVFQWEKRATAESVEGDVDVGDGDGDWDSVENHVAKRDEKMVEKRV